MARESALAEKDEEWTEDEFEDERSEDQGEKKEEPKEEEAEPEEKSEKTDIRIPKRRFDEVGAKLREERAARAAMERELQELRQATQKKEEPPAFDFEANEAAQYKAMQEGNEDEYRRLKTAERAAQREEIDRRVDRARREAAAEGGEAAARFETAREIEQTWPQFDPENPAYEEDALQEVVEMTDALRRGGMRDSDAMRKAARYVAMDKSYDRKGLNDRLGGGKRKEEAARRQPPPLSARGTGGRGSLPSAVDISRMSSEEFAKIPESQIARLRGDFFDGE